MNKSNFILLFVFVLFTSCSSDDDNPSETITLRVDHYLETAVGLEPVLVYRVQEGDQIGNDDWSFFYSDIEGFTYDLGTTYDLEVKVKDIPNPPADGSSKKYTLLNIISSNTVSPEVRFDLGLKKFNGKLFVTSFDDDYQLLNQINLDCNNLCNELDKSLRNQDEVFGLFSHSDNNTLKLISMN